MAPRSSLLKNLLFTASLLTTCATAQNTTNATSSDSCSESADTVNVYPINATGTANFSDLRISLTFGDRRNETDNFDPWTYAYLSAPKASTEQVCVYMFEGIDGARQGHGENGCGGVIPQECVDLLERHVTLPDNLLELMSGTGSYGCPPGVGLYRDDLDEACGTGTLSTSVLSTGSTLNATNMTCATSVPGLDPPEGYNTQPLFGWSLSEYDTDARSFTWYDQYVTRPVPMVVASVKDGKAQSKVMCISPDDVLEGSRVPADTVNAGGNGADDAESAAAGVRWGRKAGMASLMAGVTAVSFVLV
ncbi:hypothetical protein G6011_06763 [Alternaria panax]|uniref:Uncharacterized protein n=1 Tax=Alternaria panax TaxID=48097 RepID=A0AAD4FH14_9PLEO|nr:hypothetical protein G6011_06763 [Alternaria panax]